MICLVLILSANICRLDFCHLLPCFVVFSCGGSRKAMSTFWFPKSTNSILCIKRYNWIKDLEKNSFSILSSSFEYGPKKEAEESWDTQKRRQFVHSSRAWVSEPTSQGILEPSCSFSQRAFIGAQPCRSLKFDFMSRREPHSVTQWYTHERPIHGFLIFSTQFVEKSPFFTLCAFAHLSEQVTTRMRWLWADCLSHQHHHVVVTVVILKRQHESHCCVFQVVSVFSSLPKIPCAETNDSCAEAFNHLGNFDVSLTSNPWP